MIIQPNYHHQRGMPCPQCLSQDRIRLLRAVSVGREMHNHNGNSAFVRQLSCDSCNISWVERVEIENASRLDPPQLDMRSSFEIRSAVMSDDMMSRHSIDWNEIIEHGMRSSGRVRASRVYQPIPPAELEPSEEEPL